jgi:hypothetical protein
MPKTKARPVGRPITTHTASRRAEGGLRHVTAWVDRRLWHDLRVYALEHETTLSDLLSQAIATHLALLVDSKKGAP